MRVSPTDLLTALRFFRPKKLPDGLAELRCGQRGWEDYYRRRWQYDKQVRSTHGVNCTGSCSWNVYVKDGIIVWDTQRV
ncbi:MAG: nitrate reductase subunit alpha, partial [Deltaproteobacteria bacterium HGW-Deltaproteobacteria-21]